MNTPRTRLLALLSASFLAVSFARADETTYAGILRERDAVLSRIVTLREGQFATGTVSDKELAAARLALCSFRRDTASSPAEKIKQQELIVAVFQKQLAAVKNRASAGLGATEDVLLATDALLQAQQLFEELQLEAKKS